MVTRGDLLSALVLVLALAVFPALARDHGAIGPLHPIAEPDMLLEIEAKLRAKQASGELDRLQAAALERMRRAVAEPTPVTGLQRARESRSWLFDPSVRFDEPVADDKGRVVVAAGTLANPLSVVTLRGSWLFFDGRDEDQVRVARRELDAARAAGLPIKPILVGGSPLATSQRLGAQVFFDQAGSIVRRLGLVAVPSRVQQQGEYLLIQELAP